MKFETIRRILIVLILVNLIVMFFIIRMINKENSSDTDNTVVENMIEEELTSDGQVKEGFKSLTTLYQNYKGDISKSDIIEKLEIVVDQYFPIIYKHMVTNGEDSAEYFEENSNAIKNRFGITEVNDFINLTNEVKKINCDLGDYISYEIESDSFETDGNYTKCTLIYNYSNGQTIELELYISNESEVTDIDYMFIP